MSNGNKDKTVIGGALPQGTGMPGGFSPMPGGPVGGGFGNPPSPSGPGFSIGGAAAVPGSVPGPAGGGQGGGFSGDDAWSIGGSPAAVPPPRPAGGGQPMPQSESQRTVIGGALAPQSGFFPDASTAQPTNYSHSGPKIDLRRALTVRGLGAGGPKSPILAAAANLLILFGRLRTQMVQMEAVPLMEHVTREIETFEANCQKGGADGHQTQVAKYLLCGTADDIVQNIPGTDRHVWVQYSMVARFFNRRTSGVGFFQEIEKAMQSPAAQFQVLELGLVCLSLGFEGQYRGAPNGAAELARIRGLIHDSLRRVQARPDQDISPRWQPVDLGARRRFGGTPLWVIGSVLGVILMGAYFGLSMLIAGEGSTVSQRLLSIHPTTAVGLVRTVAFTPLEVPSPESSQLDRIRGALAGDIDAKLVEVDIKGDFIFVRVNNAALFASGKAETKPEFADLGGRIAAVLNAEPGPVIVNGFTDNVPMSGRGRFKNNHDLSLARAEAVRDVLATGISDAARFQVEGKGEADPIGDNATDDGRAANRRVEIMIKREEAIES